MKYVRIPSTSAEKDTAIDPGPYLEMLAQLTASLPTGARAFASDPGHYDFFGQRCVKDLKLHDVTFGEQTAIVIMFQHNCWKHEEDLTIRYTGVHRVTVSLGMQSNWRRLHPEVILDEVLPHSHGCSHEIAMHGGTIHIICRDLTATWTAANCTEMNAASGGRQ